jgi:hypothetical protein
MDQRGLAPSYDIVGQMANLLLQKRSQTQADPPLTVGQNWVYNLVKRHKDLKCQYKCFCFELGIRLLAYRRSSRARALSHWHYEPLNRRDNALVKPRLPIL